MPARTHRLNRGWQDDRDCLQSWSGVPDDFRPIHRLRNRQRKMLTRIPTVFRAQLLPVAGRTAQSFREHSMNMRSDRSERVMQRQVPEIRADPDWTVLRQRWETRRAGTA